MNTRKRKSAGNRRVTAIAAERTPARVTAEGTHSRQPLKDAYTQIEESRDAIIAAVIAKAVDDGNYQAAKWLFEFAAIMPAGHSSPEDQPSLMRLFLDRMQIPESPEEIAAELSANDHDVE